MPLTGRREAPPGGAFPLASIQRQLQDMQRQRALAERSPGDAASKAVPLRSTFAARRLGLPLRGGPSKRARTMMDTIAPDGEEEGSQEDAVKPQRSLLAASGRATGRVRAQLRPRVDQESEETAVASSARRLLSAQAAAPAARMIALSAAAAAAEQAVQPALRPVKAKAKAKQRMRQLLLKRRQVARVAQEKEVHGLCQRLGEHYSHMKHFLRTMTEPTLFYLPAKHNAETMKQLEDTKAAIDQKIKLLPVHLGLRAAGATVVVEDVDDSVEELEEEGAAESKQATSSGATLSRPRVARLVPARS